MPLPSYPPDLAGEWAHLRRRVRSTYTSSQRRGPAPGGAGVVRLDERGRLPAAVLPESCGALTGVLDVRSFGAAGDGEADDTEAIQTALDRAREKGGGAVWIPGGTYSVQAPPLRVYGNTTVSLAPDAVVRRDGERTLLTNGDSEQDLPGYTGHGRIRLEGGVWDGNGAVVSRHNNILSFGHATGITVRDTVVRDVPGYHAIELNAVRCARVVDVRFEGFTDTAGTRSFTEAVQLDLAKSSSHFGEFGPYDDTTCTDVAFFGCSFTGSETEGARPWPTGIGSHSATLGRSHSDVRILGCHFEDCSEEGVHAYVWDRVTVQGNTFVDCGGGVCAVSVIDTKPNDTRPPDWGEPTGCSQPLSDVAVTGNTFTGTGALAPVRITGHPNGGWVDHVTVTGNTVNGAARYGVHGYRARGVVCADNLLSGTSASAVHLDSVTGAGVTGNTVTETGGAGVYLVDVRDTVVANNSLRGIGHVGLHLQGGGLIRLNDNQVAGADSYGMRVSTGCTGISLTGNRADSGAEGLSITDTCREVVRYGNDLRRSGGLDDASPDPVTEPADLV